MSAKSSTSLSAVPKSISHITSREVTSNIAVTVETDYLEKESDPAASHYVFSYTITIENLGIETVQLLTRHWIVNSGGGEILRVNGDGVVGEQPVLEPEHGFRYTSGTSIRDSVGSMHGHYVFRRKSDSELFEVKIPRFDLIYPYLLH
jgi:ApaG protein